MRPTAVDQKFAVAVVRGRESEKEAARRAVRQATGELFGRYVDVSLEYPPNAAPIARLATGERVWVSLAHRDGRAVAVASRHAPIGVDLECAVEIAPEHARYFLSFSERRAFAHLPLRTLWALKEAAWKALELRDDAPFNSLELVPQADGQVGAVELDGKRIPATAACMEPWPGWLVALLQLEPIQ